MNNKIYPRSQDTQTVYLNYVITKPDIVVGDYTIYNDFVNDPKDFEKNNVLYHYPINHETIEQLLKLRWWDWDEEKIKNNIAAIQSGDIAKLIINDI